MVRRIRVLAIERVEPSEERAEISGHVVILRLGIHARSDIIVKIHDGGDERGVGADHYVKEMGWRYDRNRR